MKMEKRRLTPQSRKKTVNRGAQQGVQMDSGGILSVCRLACDVVKEGNPFASHPEYNRQVAFGVAVFIPRP